MNDDFPLTTESPSQGHSGSTADATHDEKLTRSQAQTARRQAAELWEAATKKTRRQARTARRQAAESCEAATKKHSALSDVKANTDEALERIYALTKEAEEAFKDASEAFEKDNYEDALVAFRRAGVAFDEADKVHPDPPPPQVDELANARAVAKEWLAATTALFGLFSLSGFIFARDAIEDLTFEAQVCVSVCALVAIACAAWSIFLGNRAAHGWLRRADKKDGSQSITAPEKGRARDSKGLRRQAERDHFLSVTSAGVALFFLVVAVSFVWFGGAG